MRISIKKHVLAAMVVVGMGVAAFMPASNAEAQVGTPPPGSLSWCSNKLQQCALQFGLCYFNCELNYPNPTEFATCTAICEEMYFECMDPYYSNNCEQYE